MMNQTTMAGETVSHQQGSANLTDRKIDFTSRMLVQSTCRSFDLPMTPPCNQSLAHPSQFFRKRNASRMHVASSLLDIKPKKMVNEPIKDQPAVFKQREEQVGEPIHRECKATESHT